MVCGGNEISQRPNVEVPVSLMTVSFGWRKDWIVGQRDDCVMSVASLSLGTRAGGRLALGIE